MVKWISNFFDSTDKEISRLRKIADRANEEIVQLLETQRESVGRIRDEAYGLLEKSGAPWQDVQGREMASVASDARRLATQVDTLRAVIEKGEATSRDLSVLLADSKQLSAMNAEKTQRPPSERRELEEEIEQL